MRHTVIVFARAPRLGTVKRRLARDIGQRAALRFHRATLIRLLRGLTAERRFRTVLAITPDFARDRLPVRIARIPQGRGDVGQRMDAAFRRFRLGTAVLIGSDIPDAGASDALGAFRALGRHDAVFGPAMDGGYWLVGMGPRRPAHPFARARWSTQHALSDTLRNFHAHRVGLVRTLRDVDRASDLPRLRPAKARFTIHTRDGGDKTMTWPTQHGVWNGGSLPFLSWKAHGTLSAAKDNVIVYPTSYGAKHTDLEWLIGPDGVLDPTRYFIVIMDQFGNGLSASPSNMPDYPVLVTVRDNVLAQRAALTDLFGIDRIACVYGWSMGALQAYHWASLFPDAVERIVVNCGVARTAVHNQVFLRSLMATLEAAPQHIGNGRFSAEPRAAKRAFGRIYAAWALSQDFYRANKHLATGPAPNLGAPDLETFLRTDWEDRFGASPAANLYAQLLTWETADNSANAAFDGDLDRALHAIRAHVLLMPGATDLYFRAADNAAELPFLRHAELRPIPSIWGHRAGNPVFNPEDALFIKTAVRDWLARDVS